ncbi:LysR family transcriptional regulator [Pluralibacter gergoviae]|uniref:LysR family transcriptional regulator n=3 Tax=Pluralibacter gergoviae TaxID=61647 RepID=A0A0F0VSZ3_PLUGE|nr:LysR substrate-binding domain-containing protein [Pluralibacter gergoviae]AVR03421.1 LysR family transcriptional regulator [Pluralibacter gergoviae]EKV0914605.1 LysR family transcriptional regulator [Pluralibacter gergoviae]EKV0928154.1 LysR family transcriptional regulator [Pluralibacter gergoviae]EKV9906016.1 LysR family transcriptional regulator [Pluralibacter gergoviae]EKW6621152.1 LysR family transcriptional regulator [Pluralibacter gergoviae]
MPHFTLKQLKYFIAVVECQSIAEASRQQHIAQPSISIAIKTLEEMFDQQFFIRHHAQGVSITPSGQRFYEKAKELLQLAWQFEQNSRADNDMVSGTVSVGCFETAAPLYMPRLIAGFKKLYPEITINIYDGEQHEIAHGLQRGRFDLAFLYDLELDGTINKEYLNAPEKPYALLPTGHPLAARGTVTLAELSREPMILLDVVPSKNYFINLFKAKGYQPQIAYSSPSIEMVRCMVGQGLGFSVLVTRPVQPVTYDGQSVTCVEILDEMKASQLAMAWLFNSEPTRPTRLFMDYCRSVDLSPQRER